MNDTTPTAPVIRLAHLYPDQLNVYGDRGNIITLTQRCQWRGITLRVFPLDVGDAVDPDAYDLFFIGGGQDKEQGEVARDMRDVKAANVRAAIDAGTPLLAVCGGYQLLCHYYRDAEGEELPGIGLFDAWTIHKGKQVARCIGNVALSWEGATLVGFENHGGRTYLGERATPLGRVLAGHGNNSEDKTEGVIYKNAYGTYLHGSLLPKNPHLADRIIALALAHARGESAPAALTPLPDDLEWQAHNVMLRRLGLPTTDRPTPAALAR
ncbi:MAG: Putative amidotransferase similar to cobyric acid synthase [Ktedonobacterales bacterium]|jgi:CobQ-like glutamine amidotransferase family enzyme|nr:MAG: Putative amidotransferase similar to cobyric acid synthase [Ktedonobacterales bacterium]